MGEGPEDARSITYQVEYADLSAGEADVSYTDVDGETVTRHVTTPWESEPIEVKAGQSYVLVASAARRDDANLVCGVHTDTGWNASNSRSSGECRYMFPDDIGD